MKQVFREMIELICSRSDLPRQPAWSFHLTTVDIQVARQKWLWF